MKELQGSWRSRRAERTARRLEDAIWARGARRPAAHDVETSFGPTRAYHWAGDGEPLVLLHGGLCTSVIWQPVVDALAGRDVWAIDVMGDVGRSRHDAPFTTEADFATWLEETLTRLELDRVHLAGHSLGGWVALHVAVHRPARLASLVLFEPGGVAPLDIRGLAVWGFPTMLGTFLPAPLRRRIAKQKRHPMAEDRLACRLMLHGTLRHRPGIPTRLLLTDEELAAISVPIALVVSEHCEMFDVAVMRARLPNASTTVVAGAGHALTVSHVDHCVAALAGAHA